MTIHARPNNNGNSYEDFVQAYTQLHDALDQVQEALKTISMDVLHGRNYQSGQTALQRASDSQNRERATKALNQLRTYESFLLQAVVTSNKGRT